MIRLDLCKPMKTKNRQSMRINKTIQSQIEYIYTFRRNCVQKRFLTSRHIHHYSFSSWWLSRNNRLARLINSYSLNLYTCRTICFYACTVICSWIHIRTVFIFMKNPHYCKRIVHNCRFQHYHLLVNNFWKHQQVLVV